MRGFLIVMMTIGAFWVTDASVFHGRFRQVLWQEASVKGQTFNYQVQYQVNRMVRIR